MVVAGYCCILALIFTKCNQIEQKEKKMFQIKSTETYINKIIRVKMLEKDMLSIKISEPENCSIVANIIKSHGLRDLK